MTQRPTATGNEEHDSLVGTLFAGRFRVESLLGTGGMGAVYLARHEVLQRRFALKVIRRELLEDLSVAARFRREARAASRIDHPNVMRIFDFGHAEGGRPYLALEYVEGPTLAETIAGRGALPVPRALAILGQCAEALEAAHAVGVIHRDLKPSNIVLGRRADGSLLVKVLDFGLAKIVGLGGTAATQAGAVFGTPEYIAPERCLGDDAEEDPRADLYSLGVIAFELLTGQTPFRGKIVQVLAAHVSEAPALPSQRSGRTDLPRELDALVLRCLAKNPDERPQTARALRDALEPIAAGRAHPPAEVAPDERTVPAGRAPTLPPPELFETIRDDGLSEAEPPPATEPEELSSRVEALAGLAYALRDESLGTPELSERVAILVEAYDAFVSHLASLRELQRRSGELEMTARLREARLSQALNQLEHELSMLDDRQSPLRDRLRARTASLARSITGVGFELAEQLDAIEERINRRRQLLGPLRAEVQQQLELLQALLARGRRELGDRCPPPLLRQLSRAGIAR
jgi:serine/threonine protein kinase